MPYGHTYYKEIDAADIGDALSFFAVQSEINDELWSWSYGLTFRSTRLYGGEGRCGDGVDTILSQGQLHVPREQLESLERVLDEFASENEPTISDEVRQEYIDDEDLCEMAELYQMNEYDGVPFEDVYFAVLGIEDPDEYDYEQAERVRVYAIDNGWAFA